MLQGRKIAPPQATESDLCFGSFRLEGVKRLWCGERHVDVRPRPLAVLRYLAERPGRLVTGGELLKHLWPGIYVTRTVLRVCVHEIRAAQAGAAQVGVSEIGAHQVGARQIGVGKVGIEQVSANEDRAAEVCAEE